MRFDHLIIGVVPQAELKIGNHIHHEDVYVKKHQKKTLVSKTGIQKLQLLQPTSSVYAKFRKEFPALFKGLGCLKEECKIYKGNGAQETMAAASVRPPCQKRS